MSMNTRSKITRLSLMIFILVCVLLETIRAQSGPADPKADFFIPILMHAWPPPTPTPRPGAVLITEIQYDAIGVEPDQEWIELYNPGDLPYLLTNVWLGDEETLGGTEGMFRFQNGTLLNAKQIMVIANRASAFVQIYGRAPDFELVASDAGVPDLIKDKHWASGNIELTNDSDEVLLRDDSGVVIDGVSWGNNSLMNPPAPRVASGHSLERRPAFIDSNKAIDWKDQPFPNPWEVDMTEPTSTPRPTSTPLNTNTPTPSPTQLPFGNERLLLTEVLYNPLGVNPEEEWFEVYNSGSGPANLYNYKIGDEETTGQGEGMMRFPPGSFLLAGEVAVVANQAASFYSNYGFYPDFELVNTDSAVPDLVSYDTWARGSINLSQAGDELLLLNKNDQVQDSLSWGNSTWAFTPSIPGVSQAHSLARVPANEDTDQASDWHDQAQPAPRPLQFPLSRPNEQQSALAAGGLGQTDCFGPNPLGLGQLSFQEVAPAQYLHHPGVDKTVLVVEVSHRLPGILDRRPGIVAQKAGGGPVDINTGQGGKLPTGPGHPLGSVQKSFDLAKLAAHHLPGGSPDTQVGRLLHLFRRQRLQPVQDITGTGPQ